MSDKPLDCVGIIQTENGVGRHDFRLNAAAISSIGSHLENLTDLTKQRDQLRAALQRLVDAKDEKDANGDTPRYRGLKAGAWEEAREVLRKVARSE